MADQMTTVYDSDQRRLPLAELRHLWQYRSLLRLLVARELTVRYKRSMLGVWWTLLNPMLTVGVYYVVFSQIFGSRGGGKPFMVYLTAGVLLAAFFTQGVHAAGAAIVSNSGILAKVYVPPDVFSLAAALAAGANFLFSLIPLLVIQVITGAGVPASFFLTVISILSMMFLITGLGLIVASVAVVFYDVFALVGVVTQLITYLAATFYPLDIIPPDWRIFVEANPLYHHMVVFRAFAYGDVFSWFSLAVTVGTGLAALGLGIWVFARNWRNVVVSL